jgi:DNA-directed RNA polymerase specialized sigma24 family protein
MSEAELLSLFRRLRAQAERMIASLSWRGVGRNGQLPNGDTAESLVQTAFERILSGAKWDEGKPLAMVMLGIIRSQVSNKVRSWENRNFSSEPRLKSEDGSDASSAFELLTDPESLSPLEFLERNEDDEEVFELLDDFSPDQPEYKVISTIFDAGGKRSEIIESSGLTEKEYEATKKRLRTYLEKKWQKEPLDQHKEIEVNP